MKIPGAWMAQQVMGNSMRGVKQYTGLKEEAQVDLASIIADVVTQNYPGAAAGVVSLYGDMTNNDALSDSADAAGTVMGIGGAVKGLGKAAIKQTAKEAAKQGASEIAKEGVSEIAKEGVQEGLKISTQEAAKEAAKAGMGSAMMQGARDSVKGALQPVAVDAAKAGGQNVMQTALDGIIKDQSKTSLKTVMNSVLGDGNTMSKIDTGMGKAGTIMSMIQALQPPPAQAPGASANTTGFTPSAVALRQVLAQQGIANNPFTAKFTGG